MSKDQVIQVLGAHVVMAEPTAELWHRVALGELQANEAAARLLGARQELSEDEQSVLDRAKMVFVPPSEELRRAQLAALLSRRAAEGEDHAEDRAVVLPMRSPRIRRWMVGLLGAAASVALTVWLLPARPEGHPRVFSGAYTIELEKAADTVRGAEPRPEVPMYPVDGKIGIRLVPEEEVDGPLGVVAFVWDQSGSARRVELEATIHEHGVVEIDTTVQALGLTVGEWELVLAVGWVRALPDTWEELVTEEADSTDFDVVRARVRVVSRS
ncbi:hypothetical protein [Paraliomyxa miuraensis]|uniref:hypothetical protein n=1 Tax=Paraliomyxa miuraensis TaxID=376150 RepID=UPI00225C3B4B|nr:hypothetical protein [Paraliomyxa miuraensis]MCX4246478.1 hypothetical protein [Paraliomyxa miuraensis]